MTSRELVLAALRGERTPRPPVICGGGMMSFAVLDAMQASGAAWPEAHRAPEQMARLALDTQRLTCFDCAAVPFCMTVEAEALGAQVDFGDREVQPRVVAEPMSTVDDLGALRDGESPGRRQVALAAIRTLRALAPGIAIVGGVVGPLSLAAQVLEASALLRATRRAPQSLHALVSRCAEVAESFAREQVAAGADVITISDPTATGEVVGGRGFAQFAEPYLRRVVAAVHSAGAAVIAHVCGRPQSILPSLAALGAECISVDETAPLPAVRAALDGVRLMGNIGAGLLQDGPVGAISANCRGVLKHGVDILAPGCGVIAATPTEHLRAMVEVSKGVGR